MERVYLLPWRGRKLWPSQETFVREVEAHPKLIVLKARKLGITTVETAYDAWVLLTQANSRVHGYSSKDNAAQDILERVSFGLRQLPEWLRPDIVRSTTHVLELGAGEDRRTMQVYATGTESVAVEQTATHTHCDEWSRMLNPAKVFQAIEPTIASTGTAHILLTSGGGRHHTSEFFRKSVAGDNEFHAVFLSARLRPGRDDGFFASKLRTMTREMVSREYPQSMEDAMSSEGGYVFTREDLEVATEHPLGPTPVEKGFAYVKAWDIGRYNDPSVGVVLQISDSGMHDVVHLERHVNMDGPKLKARIEHLHRAYPGPTVIEDNGPGWAVREGLDLPEREVIGFTMTRQSKPRIIGTLRLTIEQNLLSYDAEAWPQLHRELIEYQEDDETLVQDCVMALALADYHAGQALKSRSKRGRAGRIIRIDTSPPRTSSVDELFERRGR